MNFPTLGDIFELTLDRSKVTTKKMPKKDGYGAAALTFLGRDIENIQTKEFKLVRVYYCEDLHNAQNIHSLLSNIKQEGKLAEGKWREVFKKKFPRPLKTAFSPDESGPIGFAGSMPGWVEFSGKRWFPSLVVTDNDLLKWKSTFHPVHGRFVNWLWLVEIS